MKNWMSLFLSTSLVLAGGNLTSAVAAEDEAVRTTDTIFKLTKDVKTVRELLKTLEGRVSKETLDFAKQKLKNAPDAKLEVRRISSRRLQINVAKASIPIEYVGLADGSSTQFHFLINNQEVELSSEATPQENYDAVMKAMPKRVSMFWSLVLPQADAQDIGSMIMPLVTIGASVWMFSQIMQMQNQQAQYAYYPMQQAYPCYSINGALTCGPQPSYGYSPQQPYYQPAIMPQTYGYGTYYPNYAASTLSYPYVYRYSATAPVYETFVSH